MRHWRPLGQLAIVLTPLPADLELQPSFSTFTRRWAWQHQPCEGAKRSSCLVNPTPSDLARLRLSVVLPQPSPFVRGLPASSLFRGVEQSPMTSSGLSANSDGRILTSSTDTPSPPLTVPSSSFQSNIIGAQVATAVVVIVAICCRAPFFMHLCLLNRPVQRGKHESERHRRRTSWFAAFLEHAHCLSQAKRSACPLPSSTSWLRASGDPGGTYDVATNIRPPGFTSSQLLREHLGTADRETSQWGRKARRWLSSWHQPQ